MLKLSWAEVSTLLIYLFIATLVAVAAELLGQWLLGLALFIMVMGVFLINRKRNEFDLYRRHVNQRHEYERACFCQFCDSLPQTIFELDRDGAFTFINRSGREMLGYTGADIERGLRFLDVIHPDSREAALAYHGRVFGGRQDEAPSEYLALRKDGQEISVLLQSHIIAENGQAKGLRGIIFDFSLQKEQRLRAEYVRDKLARQISEREQELAESHSRLKDEAREHAFTEDMLRKSRQLYRSLFEHVHDAVYSLSPDGNILSVNPEFERKTGWGADESFTRPFAQFLDEGSRAVFEENFAKALRGEACQPYELVLKTKKGGFMPIEVSESPLYDGTRLAGALGVARDLSERKRTQRTLIHSERMAAVGILAGGIAHEFNNINVGVLGYAEMALSRPDITPESKKFLERIRKSALRAKAITRNLMTFAGQQDGVRRNANLAEIARQTLSVIEKQFVTEGVFFDLELREVPDTVFDTAEISQVLLNLLINAKHALLNCPQKIISIRTGSGHGRVWVKITDTGCGISEDNQKKIFNPFFSTKGEHARKSSIMTQVKGMGLGLSICHAIIEQHNGEITVESVPGHGATFTVSLPLTEADAAKPDAASATENARQAPLPGRVLVLDDEEFVLDIVKTILEENGMEVETTDDGENASALLRAREFDLLLVDLQMPKMPGLDFLRKIHAEMPDLRAGCILITGKNPSELDLRASGVDFFDVLEKPFSKIELTGMVKAALSRRNLKGSTH